MKFQPTPSNSNARVNCQPATPELAIATQPASSRAPTSSTARTPNLAIRRPVPKEGANMPTRCSWITCAAVPTPSPQPMMASGVAVMMKLITV